MTVQHAGSPGASEKEGYRPHIDGLRAIAVLSVIVFHLDGRLLPGGFVGVDIFFVISGFLITRNILAAIEAGRFSLVEFYRRRIKRIAPAMLVVVAATLVAAQLLLLPEDARNNAKAAVWSLASFANVYFWLFQDTGYFAADSSQIPLLHLWSLGVEEQFYMLWPLLLMFVYPRVRPVWFAVITVGIIVVSVALGDLLFQRDPGFVYYMLPTRAGELMIGALAAHAVVKGWHLRIPASFGSPAAIAGYLLLAASLVFTDEAQPFPGWRALPPTVGAALLILAGHLQGQGARLTQPLALPVMVGIGLVSYSAYLWHWPLLALYRYGYGEPGLVSGATIFVLTMLLAWLTYRYVELPARRTSASALLVFARHFALPAGSLLVVSLLLIYPHRTGLAVTSRSYQQELAAIREQTRPAFQFDWVCQRQRLSPPDIANERCVLGANGKGSPSAILWGDSNASHFIGMLDVFGKQAGFSFRNVAVGACPPVYSDPAPFVDTRRERDCRDSLQLVRPALDAYPVVIMAATWLAYQNRSDRFLDALHETVRQLAASGKQVILIGRAPVIDGYDRLCREKALSYPLLACPAITVPLRPDIAAFNDRLRRLAETTPGVRYYDATSHLCPGGQCPAFASDGTPRYFDTGHLTMAASARLGAEILEADGVPAAFASIAAVRK